MHQQAVLVFVQQSDGQEGSGQVLILWLGIGNNAVHVYVGLAGLLPTVQSFVVGEIAMLTFFCVCDLRSFWLGLQNAEIEGFVGGEFGAW
jgi:hypothetical protein